jgi:hypothetical protein
VTLSALPQIAVYFGADGIHETLGTGVDSPCRRGRRRCSLDAAFLITLVEDKPLFGVVTLRAHVSVMLETGHKLTSSVTVIRIISAPQAIQRILAAPLLSSEIQEASMCQSSPVGTPLVQPPNSERIDCPNRSSIRMQSIAAELAGAIFN